MVNQIQSSKGILRVTWLALLVLFLVNLSYAGFLAVSHDKASGDALSYYALAVNLYEGQGFSRDYKSDLATPETAPPFSVRGRFLYPYLVSLAFRLFGVSIPTANLVAAFFKALLVIPLVLLGKFLFADDLTGLAAGLVYTVGPVYTALGTIAMPETTTAAWYYIGLVFLVLYYRNGGRRWLLLAGLSLSLSYLARPEGLFLILLGLVTIILRRAPWVDVGYLLMFPFLTATVGSLIIYGQAGNVSPYATPLTTLPDWADYYVLGGFSLATYLDRAGGLAGAFAVRVYNCLLFLRNTFADGLWLDRRVGLLPFTLIPALVAALARPLPRRERVYLYILTAFIAAQFVLTIGYPGYPRMSADYRHGQIIGPFLIVLAGAGLVFLCRGCCRWARGGIPWGSLGRAFGYLLAANYVVFSVVFLSLELNDTLWTPTVQEPLVEAAQWARANLPPSAVIMSRRPVVANYVAGRTSVIIPTATYADIVAYAQQHGGTHFIITDQERTGVPNLVQALDVYADHYRRLYTADTFSIVAVKSYDYGGVRPTVPDDWYVGPENVRRYLWAWPDLWAVERSHAFEEVWDVWSQWLLRVKKGAWTLAKDRTLPTPMRYPVGASLGDGVLLMGYDLNVERVRPGETAELTLYWRCLRPMPADYTVFTHALDPGGLVRAQKDSQPLGGAHPTHRWQVNEIVRDRYALTLDPVSPPGSYSVEVGMYDANTGERLTVRDQAGVALPDKRALLGPIKVK